MGMRWRARVHTPSLNKKPITMMRSTLTAFALVLAAAGAQAQLNKCVNEHGKVEYRDIPCQQGNQQRGMMGGTVSGVQALSEQEIDRAKALSAAEQRRAPQATVIGAGQPGQPTQQDIKNLETSASSVTRGRKERDFMRAEVERAKAAAAGDGSYSREDLQSLKQRQAEQSRIDANDRSAARRSAEATHLRAGGQSPTTGIVLDRQEEAARAAARREQAARAAAAAQARANPCLNGNCTDDRGNRYTGSGNQLMREDGKMCTTLGNQVECK